MRKRPAGRRSARRGVRRDISSKRSRRSATRARPAMAMRCKRAFVEPPSAMSAMIALSNEAALRKRRGFKSRQMFSTICRPDCAAMRQCDASLAGMEDAPGKVRPSVSAIAVMVEAVPIVMQWPCDRAIPSSTSRHCSSVRLPARFSAQNFHVSEPLPRTSPCQLLPATWGRLGQR